MGGPSGNFGNNNSSGSSFRNPPVAIREKYNLAVLPEDFEPTKQENDLLGMYETIRLYEKEAARIKEESARAKLEAAAAKYEQQQQKQQREQEEAQQEEDGKQPAMGKARKKKAKRQSQGEDADGMDMGDDNSEDDMDDEEDDVEEDRYRQEERLYQKREAKLQKLRDEVAKYNKEDDKEEEMRQAMLGSNESSLLDEPRLTKKRKAVDEDDDGKEASLIDNLTHMSTPPHEFSKKLELKPWEGTALYPQETGMGPWTPPPSAMNPNDEALEFKLDKFDMSQTRVKGYNTIAIKYTVPSNSKRFSFNIAGPSHRDYESVLFHFNPRQFEKGGQLVLNSKLDGLWGQSISVPLSRVPKMFGEISCTLIIQVHDEGFDVFLEDQHCARLEHRSEVPPKGNLFLQLPATDDYGALENWSVFKVWWGHKAIMAKEDVSSVHGVNAFSGMHPRKLFIKGLTKISTQAQIDLRRAELERAFRKYGGKHGVVVTVPTHVTFAFVECDSEKLTNVALEEMSNTYDIKRARRSRYEALQEERAAKAQKTKESTAWD